MSDNNGKDALISTWEPHHTLNGICCSACLQIEVKFCNWLKRLQGAQTFASSFIQRARVRALRVYKK